MLALRPASLALVLVFLPARSGAAAPAIDLADGRDGEADGRHERAVVELVVEPAVAT